MVNTEIRLIIFFAAKWRSSIQSAKTRPGSDCGSDHELLIAKFRLKLKKVGKMTRPFRYDLNQVPWTSLVAQMVKRLSTMQEAQVRSLVHEDPLEKEMAIHSSTIAWKIPWTEEPGRLESMGSQRVGHDWVTSLFRFHFSLYHYTVELGNRFNGLDLIEYLMNYGMWFVTLYRRQGSRPSTTTTTKKWKKKAKWLSEEALQIAMKRREVEKTKYGEKERYTHLNAEFQRIARRHKKAFTSDQCKEIQENNRMGKTRDLSRKLKMPRKFSCKHGHNKGQKWYGPNTSRRY